MKNSSLLLLLAACAVVAGCLNATWSGSPTVKGSGHLASETRSVSQFDRVAVHGAGELSLVQGEQESLTIETDDNLLPLIKSEVAGGALRIGPDNVSISPSKSIRYRLQLKSLKELRLSGSLEAESQAIKTDHLLIDISGSGEAQIRNLEATDLEVQISGSGDIQLAGKVSRQNVRISGSGDYRAGDCESQSTAIHVSGSGNARVWARGTLEAEVSGSGEIKYHGSPQVSSHVSGSGTIQPIKDVR